MQRATPASEVLDAIEGGVFVSRIEQAVADTALATVVRDGKVKGKVSIDLEFSRLAESSQVVVTATVKFDAPTTRGRRSESYTCETPMHVESGGRLTLFPEAAPLFRGEVPAIGGRAHAG
jgi:hypothetical protein